jgi:hypothetical protein
LCATAILCEGSAHETKYSSVILVTPF